MDLSMLSLSWVPNDWPLFMRIVCLLFHTQDWILHVLLGNCRQNTWQRQENTLYSSLKTVVWVSRIRPVVFIGEMMYLVAYTTADEKKHSTSQMAHDVIDLLDHLGWKQGVHLDGVSMGGMISLELVSTWPERFASLVLTSTSSGRQVPPVSVLVVLSRRDALTQLFLSGRQFQPWADWFS